MNAPSYESAGAVALANFSLGIAVDAPLLSALLFGTGAVWMVVCLARALRR